MSSMHLDVKSTVWWIDLFSWSLNKLSHQVSYSSLHSSHILYIMILSYILNQNLDYNNQQVDSQLRFLYLTQDTLSTQSALSQKWVFLFALSDFKLAHKIKHSHKFWVLKALWASFELHYKLVNVFFKSLH